MGADIHFFIETKKDKELPWTALDFHDWHQEIKNISSFGETVYEDKWLESDFGSRNYQMFGILADVRTDGVLYPPKGLPKDLSPELKNEIDHWAGDGHSHSYLTLEEYRECVDTYILRHEHEPSDYGKIHEMALNWLINETTETQLLGSGLEPQIRFVFWFDN